MILLMPLCYHADAPQHVPRKIILHHLGRAHAKEVAAIYAL